MERPMHQLKSHAKTHFGLAAAVALLLAASPAWAETVDLAANLTGPGENPPTTSKGTGTLKAAFDTATKKLNWTVTYSGLSGPPIAAHFHGPAPVGKNAPVEVPLSNVTQNPIVGSATLTDAQAKDLLSGNVYINIHTQAHKPGEIRGQVEKAQ